MLLHIYKYKKKEEEEEEGRRERKTERKKREQSPTADSSAHLSSRVFLCVYITTSIDDNIGHC